MTNSKNRALSCATLCLCVLCSTIAGAGSAANSSSYLSAAPSPLLAIDQNRSTVIDRIVGEWGEALLHSNAGIDPAQLRTMLTGMRSDYLLAASVAGTLDGLRNVISSALITTAPVKPPMQLKSLGDASDDLVYTPVVPCRIVDTRTSQGGPGAIGSFATYDIKVWVASGGFSAQGGDASNCNIPANPAAVALNFAAVDPAGPGNLIAYPAGASLPNTSVLNYQSGTSALSNGAIIKACAPNCAKQVSVKANGARWISSWTSWVTSSPPSTARPARSK